MTAMYSFVVLALFVTTARANLLVNGGFEDDFNGNWYCVQCTLGRSSDANSGSSAGQVTNRNEVWAGVSQNVALQPGRKYYFESMVKILNHVGGAMWHAVTAYVEIRYADGETEYAYVGQSPHVRTIYGYQFIAGDLYVKNKAVTSARAYVQADPAGVNYLIDTAQLVEIVDNPNWKAEADARIEQYRKTDITFRFSTSQSPNRVELELDHKKHTYPFGTAVVATRINGNSDTDQRYQNYFYDRFNWAVLENAHKWKQMEPNQGQIDYERPESAVDTMRGRGITVRGHCVYWGVDERVQDWLKTMSSSQVQNEVNKRADGVVTRFRGKLAHWDVNNENLHGTFFEEKTGNPDMLLRMFDYVNNIDSQTKLFLNDFNIYSSSAETSGYLNSAFKLKSQNTPVYGLGVQSHLSQNPDIARIAKRHELLSKANLPIWITELDITNTDRNQRANNYEDVLRFYFSQENIEGILLWGFWDGNHWKPDAALVEGPNWTINAAGQRFDKLLKQDWATNKSYFPTSQNQNIDDRIFQGVYELRVKVDGNVVRTQEFTVNRGDRVYVDVNA